MAASVALGAVLAGQALLPSAAAHNPRNTPAGAPRMDLEVMVTPEIEGRITPGGTDPLVAVDGFGNRYAVARKEDSQALVGVDQRSRTATRLAAWAWTSDDDGLTWRNLETVTRGLDTLLPQGLGRDVAAAGPLGVVAEAHAAAVVITRVAAQGKGRLTGLTPTAVPLEALATGAPDVTTDGTAVTLAVPTAGGTLVRASADQGATFGPTTTLPGTCAVAADPRAPRRTTVAVCASGRDLTLHRSTDGGATFGAARALGARDDRADGGVPRVDVGPDGTVVALSGLTLVRVPATGRVLRTDVARPGGEHHGLSLAVSSAGKVALGAYHRPSPEAAWQVMVALVPAGRAPVWYPFADHDPATPPGADPPAVATGVDTDPRGRLQLVWATTFLHQADLGRPLLRNVFTARSTTS